MTKFERKLEREIARLERETGRKLTPAEVLALGIRLMLTR